MTDAQRRARLAEPGSNEQRIAYTEASIERFVDVLSNTAVRQVLGERAVRRFEGLLERFFVPNVAFMAEDRVSLTTPREYQNDWSIPVMAGFPAELLARDTHMLVPTADQADSLRDSLSKHTDAADAGRMMKQYGSQLASKRQKPALARYDTIASVQATTYDLMIGGRPAFVMSRPMLMPTFGTPEQAYTQLNPATFGHESRHVWDFLRHPLVFYGDTYRKFVQSTEMRGYHIGYTVTRALEMEGLLCTDDYGPDAIAEHEDDSWIQEDVERIRLQYANLARPFYPRRDIYEALVALDVLGRPEEYECPDISLSA